MASTIEWTQETWNPVTGCTRVSPGCDNCYMFALYPRLRGMRVPGYEKSPDVVTLLPERLSAPLKWPTPRRVFVNSMSDLFHQAVPDEFILRVFQVMRDAAQARGHVFQVLTKRPGRAVAWWARHSHLFPQGWPRNIWLGTSVENQKYAPRITVLARVPAAIKFVSVEPLLGPVDLSKWLSVGNVQWVIVGGESGPHARPMETRWVEALREQCAQHDVSFFVKQLGRRWALANDATSHKGGDIDEWPERFAIRQYPVDIEIPAVELIPA